MFSNRQKSKVICWFLLSVIRYFYFLILFFLIISRQGITLMSFRPRYADCMNLSVLQIRYQEIENE